MANNPFQFGAANDFSPEKVLEYYIEDFNYSRFIHSTRNVFVLGERGSGKTMTLLYHTLATQRRKAEEKNVSRSLDHIGVYIPCNTPLMHRTEHELFGAFKAEVLSEHFLVLGIAYWLAKTLDENADLVGDMGTSTLGEELGEAIGRRMQAGKPFFKQVLAFARQEIRDTQRVINRADSESFYNQALSFSTLLMPLFELLRQISALSSSHFLLMVDDAHDLNPHQIRVLNSWIAYRDHPAFSFKVATVKVDRPPLITSTGGFILEGHDFTVVDMEKPVQNEQSEFGRLGERIIGRRLERIGCNRTPEEFFPVHSSVTKGLAEAKEAARAEALKRYPDGSKTQISDYVYKYQRAIYFRRSQKANLPVYSGFKTIVYLSTGVVRNLLEPCYWMYEKALSEAAVGAGAFSFEGISPTIQNAIIMQQSGKAWERLRDGLDKVVVGCSDEDGRRVHRLFEQLAVFFRARLFSEGSEPRATSFSISGRDQVAKFREVERLLRIARKATLLYAREGAAKDYGSREYYYVPNRILWPIRGLDPQGQHARVSLPVSKLLAAALGEGDLKEAGVGCDTAQEHFSMENVMSRTVDVVVTVASWEPRFIRGIERTLTALPFRRLLAYFIGEYGDRTEEARRVLRRMAKERPGVTFEEEEMSFGAPGAAWRMLERDLGPGAGNGGRVLVDLTTMPREVIWSALFWLEAASADVQYVYNRPAAYAEDWLARDPNEPRLVFKLAGTLEVGRPTALVAVTGFDENRCRQAIEFYEPARVLLAAQGGRQYDNNVRNVGPSFAAGGIPIEHVEIDAFGEDHGYSALRRHLESLTAEHNVILCSFGPKPSAIALYRLQREFPQSALAYIGCKEYNPDTPRAWDRR